MSYRKWRENKQQLIRWPELVLLGLCLVSLHFRCDILAPIPVQLSQYVKSNATEHLPQPAAPLCTIATKSVVILEFKIKDRDLDPALNGTQ